MVFFGGKSEENQGHTASVGGDAEASPSAAHVQMSGALMAAIMIPDLFSLVSFFLNAMCFMIMVIKSQCTYTSALNLLMMAFLLSMAYFSLNSLICSILGEVLSMENEITLTINQIGDLFTTYFSVLLLFLIGLNRDATYMNPTLFKTFFKRKVLAIFLVILAVLCLIFSFFIFTLGGLFRKKDSDGLYSDYALNPTLVSICTYMAYGIALSSGIFYTRVFFHLKQQRIGVTHDKTKELLDKAERTNCAQATFILSMYLISLIAFILCDNIQISASRRMMMHSLQSVVNTIPSLGIPLAMLVYCEKMRSILKHILLCKKDSKKCRPSSSSTASTSLGRRTTLSVVSTL